MIKYQLAMANEESIYVNQTLRNTRELKNEIAYYLKAHVVGIYSELLVDRLIKRLPKKDDTITVTIQEQLIRIDTIEY